MTASMRAIGEIASTAIAPEIVAKSLLMDAKQALAPEALAVDGNLIDEGGSASDLPNERRAVAALTLGSNHERLRSSGSAAHTRAHTRPRRRTRRRRVGSQVH